MKDFKRGAGFRGGFGGHGNSGNKGFSGKGGSFRKEMFQATCDRCGKECEVPFRPNGKKPVFCRDCFAKNGSAESFTRSTSPRGDTRPSWESSRRTFKKFTDHGNKEYPSPPRTDTFQTDQTKKLLESMNTKLDALMVLLTDSMAPTAVPKTGSMPPKPATKEEAPVDTTPAKMRTKKAGAKTRKKKA